MTSLFSSFDLKIFYFQISLLFLSMFIIPSFSFKISNSKFLVGKFILLTESFFNTMKPDYFNKFFCSLISMTMIFIFIMNFLGVFPYNFAFSSQMSTLIPLSMGLWVALFSFFVATNFKGLISHMIPDGTPILLTWFLFMIELVSNIIRPVTLMVRLLANIVAGHLLMMLLFKLVTLSNIVFPTYIFLNLVEVFVSIIQSYIFATMLVMYFADLE